VIGHAQQGPGHRGAGLHFLHPLPRMIFVGDTAQHMSSALPISNAATRSMSCSSSCVLVSMWPPRFVGRPLPAGTWALLKKSNPHARSDTERPVTWLPAPGLETTSAVKQSSASAGSSHPRFSARNGHPARDIKGLGGLRRRHVSWHIPGQGRCGVSVSDRDSPLITVRSGTPRARAPRCELAPVWSLRVVGRSAMVAVRDRLGSTVLLYLAAVCSGRLNRLTPGRGARFFRWSVQ